MKKHSNRDAYEKKKVSDSTTKAVPLKTEEKKDTEPKTASLRTDGKKGTSPQAAPKKTAAPPRQKEKKHSFSSGKMALLCGVIVVVVILVFVLIYSAFGNKEGFSASFTVNSSTATLGNNAITMEHAVLGDEGVSVVPVVDASEILPISVKWKDGDKKATIKGNGVKIKLTVDKKTVTVNGEEEEWSVAPIIDDDTLYVPLSALCDALGYNTVYVEPMKKVNVFPPDEKNAAPTVTFTTDKDSYEVGETINYTVNAEDPDGDDIAEYKWENYQESFDEAGSYDITLSIMDAKGDWSDTVSKTITVTEAPEEDTGDAEE